MSKYNVSKAESAKLGIPRVATGSSSKSGSSKSSSSSKGSMTTGKFDFSPDTSNLAKLQKQYISSLSPTAAETGLETQLGNVMTGRDLGIQAASQQPIEAPLIRGEQAAKMRAAEIQTQPLISRLSQLQAQREAQQRGYQSMMGFEESNLNRQFQIAQEKARQAQIDWENQMAQKQFDLARQKAGGGGTSLSSGGINFNWPGMPGQMPTPEQLNKFYASIPVTLPENVMGFKPRKVTPGLNAPTVQEYTQLGIDPNPWD